MIKFNFLNIKSNQVMASLKISVNETVGSCVFNVINNPTNTSGFSYRITFSKAIDDGSFSIANISNLGTGGSTTLTWLLENCGDDQNYKLTASAVSGDGTIIPSIETSTIHDLAGNTNIVFGHVENSVTYDTTGPSVIISRSVLETVGSCSFTSTNANEHSSGFSYRVAFSEKIDASNFEVTDVTNTGTGGATTLDWSITSCGDDENFRLTVTGISGEGTISPQILASQVTDLAGNQNVLSTSSNGTVFYELLGWRQEAYIKAANNGSYDSFGSAVSVNGDTLAVSARNEASNATTITNGTSASADNSNADSGAVYVYKRSGVTWQQEAYIKAVNNGAGDWFGISVSLSGDTLVVGAYLEDSNVTTITNGTTASADNSNTDSGAVYVYKRSGVTWQQEAYIKAVNNDSSDLFGFSVSLYGDTIAVGAKYERSNLTIITNGTTASADNSRLMSGAVYIYKRFGSVWDQEAYIKAVNSGIADYFGDSVSISEDTLAVGAFGESSNLTTITNGTSASADNSNDQSGAVYVYKRSGVTWQQEAYIKAANNDTNDRFGSIVSLSGETLAVGVYSEDSNQTTITNGTSASADNSNTDSGAVYVYKRSGVTWQQEAYIKAVNNGAGDWFGASISLSGDTLAVGAYNESSNQTTITNGINASSDDSSLGSGAVYIYKRSGVTWEQEAYVKAVNNELGDAFGFSVSLSGDTLAVGAWQEDSSAITITNGTGVSDTGNSSNSGAVYVYRSNARLFGVTDIFQTVTANSISLKWIKTGGTATGYGVNYQAGTSPPVLCSVNMDHDVGDNDQLTINSLIADTNYTFRFCVYDEFNNFVEDKVITVKTNL